MPKKKRIVKLLEKIKSKINNLDTTGLKQTTRNGETTMRGRAWDIVDHEIKKLTKK